MDQGPVKSEWKERFRAWWEGYEWTPAPEPAAQPSKAVPAPAAPSPSVSKGMTRQGKPMWTAARIEVAEKCWGEDFTSPGGAEHAIYLVKPLGISPEMSVLDMSAGIGGSARAIAKEFKAWITGLEPSELLAKIGMERSIKAGLAKHAPISEYDPEDFHYDKKVDCIFAKESFFTIGNKKALFDGLDKALKPHGQLLFTDYVLDEGQKKPALDQWADHEHLEPHLLTDRQIVEELQKRKLDVRINEDITDTYKHLILAGLSNLVDHTARHSLDKETKAAVVEEIELWARRMAAFDAGLRVYRYHAIKK